MLTQQIYSEETNGAHAHNRDRVPLNMAKKNYVRGLYDKKKTAPHSDV